MLAAGDPVVIGIPVYYYNFFFVGSTNNGLYTSPSGSFEGDHAIAALGYNSTGLVIENTRGPTGATPVTRPSPGRSSAST